MSRADGEGLLAAIAAAPDDDLPRLVYADWLDDHGDRMGAMRAKFIRLQIARARQGLTVRPSPAEWTILRVCAGKWHPDWPDGWHGAVQYDRGFPYHVALSFEQPTPLSDPSPELATVRSVSVHPPVYFDTGGSFGAAVAGMIAPLPLTHLALGSGACASSELWQAVPKSIADLVVEGDQNQDFLNAMVAGRRWPNVRRLAVSALLPYPDAGAVLDGGGFPVVVDLTFNAADAPAVLRSPLACRARRLSVDCLDSADAESLVAVLDGRTLPGVSELLIDNIAWGWGEITRGVAALAAGRLSVLALHYASDGARPNIDEDRADGLAAAILAGPALKTLRHLDLAHWRFTPAAARALIEAAADAGVKRLALHLPYANAEFARYLSTAPALDAFTRFELPDHFSPPEVLAKLAARLGPRAATSCITRDYFAATRRWRPL